MSADERPRALYRRVLGEAFERLPSAVRQLHDNPGRVTASGRCTVERGGNPLARLIAALFGFPPAGEDLPLGMVIEAAGQGERWTRNFAGFRTISTQGEVPGEPGRLFERFGASRFVIDPRPSDSGLSFALTGARLFGLPLPRAFWPDVVGDATAQAGRYAFHVSIALPLIGLLVRYRGELVPES